MPSYYQHNNIATTHGQAALTMLLQTKQLSALNMHKYTAAVCHFNNQPRLPGILLLCQMQLSTQMA